MRRVTIRLSAQDEEKLTAICKQDGVQMSNAIRSLLNREDDQKTIIAELVKVQNAISAISKSNGGDAERPWSKSAETKIAEEALAIVIDLAARNYLLTMKFAEQKFGENFVMSAD